jgi:hypothetical protein
METLGNYSVANCGKKMAKEYFCEKCDYKCFKKYNWDKHLATSKHLSETIGTNEEMANGKKWQNTKLYSCQLCPKEFSNRSGLWKHKQKCNQEQKVEKDETKQETTKNEINFDKELIMMLIKQNAELMEIVKNGTHNNTTNNTNTHTNSHNKAFNLNFFLNETCKNAMNITDFVDSIKLQLTDLMEVGELGYVEGISKIIVKNLNNLDETIRPVHCTDKKRETMYVKDQGEWSKEDENQTRLKKAINKIADKNIRLLPQFREKYPEYNNSASKMSDKYEKMVIEVMETDNDKKEKIIKNISKATTIKDDN